MHAIVAAVVLAALSLIGFAVMPARVRPRRAGHAIAASLSLGAIVVGWSAFVAGTLIGTWTIVPLLALAAVASVVRATEWARTLRRAWRELSALAARNPLATIALFFAIALALPQLLLPVVDSDGLRYHLALPKLFLMTGRVFFYPFDTAGALPQSAEMIYLAAMQLGGGETAKFIHFGFFLATLPVVALLSRSMLAPLFYAAAPLVIAGAGTAFIDHIATFHVAVAALLLFRREPDVLAGASLGAALATKITTMPAVAALALYAMIRSPLAARRSPLAILAPILIAIAPFAIRASYHTGDPLFPLGYTMLGKPIPNVPAERAQFAAASHRIAWWPDPEHAQSDEVAGVHHLAGLLAMFIAVRRKSTRKWLWLVVPWLVAAIVIHPSTRFFLPMFLGLALFEAATLSPERRHGRRTPEIIAVAAVIPALVMTANVTLHAFAPGDYLLGRITREQFLATRVAGYRAARIANRGNGTIMALDFPAPYYFDRPFIAEGLLNEPPLREWLQDARSADDLLRRLHAANVRTIVVTPGYGGGTPAALLPLARTRREAALITALRRRLRLVATVDRTDVVAVP